MQEGNTAFNNRLERAPIMCTLPLSSSPTSLMFAPRRSRSHSTRVGPASTAATTAVTLTSDANRIIWSVGIPIQHSAYIRRHYISLHRFSGWAVFSSVLVLTCTGLLFSPFKLAYTHPDALHLHRPFPDIKALAWIVWPTFEASLWIIGPIQIATAVMTVQAAREKKIARHRTLANLHTVSGLVIHIQRVNLVVTKAIAAVLLALNQDQRDGLGVPKDARDFWKGEMAGFALTVRP